MDAPMVPVSEDRPPEYGIDWPLWFGVLGGPIAWSLHLIVCYLLVRPVCQDGGILALHAVSLVLTLVAAGAAFVSWRRWHGAREEDMAGAGTREGFMALYGILSGALFTVAILVAWAPIFFINPCLEA